VNPRPIRSSYATHVVRGLPASEEQLERDGLEQPAMGDVLVAEVTALGRHRRIEAADRRPTALFAGDLVTVVYGERYATAQYEGQVPESAGPCHLLSAGGVCGRVVGMAGGMEAPTLLRPIAFPRGSDGGRINLCEHGLAPIEPAPARPRTILVVGSSMDAGKTTTVAALVNGLACAGATVAAAKLTGTASARDVSIMEDAGACPVLDFTDAGHPSTAGHSREALEEIERVLASNLAAHRPELVLFEIADGITQRETRLLLESLAARSAVDHVFFACSDPVAAVAGVKRLRDHGLPVAGVSGRLTMHQELLREAQLALDVPILRLEELRAPSVLERLRPSAPHTEAQAILRA